MAESSRQTMFILMLSSKAWELLLPSWREEDGGPSKEGGWILRMVSWCSKFRKPKRFGCYLLVLLKKVELKMVKKDRSRWPMLITERDCYLRIPCFPFYDIVLGSHQFETNDSEFFCSRTSRNMNFHKCFD